MKNKYNKLSYYFFLNKKAFILSTISGIFYNTLMVFVPLLLGNLIDLYNLHENKNDILVKALLFFLLIIFIQFNRYLKRFFVRDFANKMILNMREVFFNNLLHENIDVENKGDLITKAMSDINDTAEGVRKILTEVFDTLILFSGYTISLLILDYKITLLSYISIVISIIVSHTLKSLIYKNQAIYKSELSKNKKLTLSLISNELNYRSFGVSNNYEKKYEKDSLILKRKSIKTNILKDSQEPLYMAIALIGLFIVIYYSSLNVINDIWLIGTFTSFLSTYMLVARKASKLGKLFNAKASLDVSWKRIRPYLNECEEKNLDISLNNRLIVSNMSFSFDDSFELSNVSFNATSGEVIGVCGEIRSGKSMLLKALSGIYSYTGSIRLNDIELKDVKNINIDNFIAYDETDSIFSDTLKTNITLGKDIDINKYLRAVYLEEDVSCFKDKENELIYHSTRTLSGGQTKRLLIARALLSNSHLILFDDVFTSFDTNMAINILNNIKSLVPSSIVIFVSNNKDLLSKTDQILYLENGKTIVDSYYNMVKVPKFNKLIGGKNDIL